MDKKIRILVTGGSGYIGSHTLVELLKYDQLDITVFDNLSNSSRTAIERVETITGKKVNFIIADMRDIDAMNALFTNHGPFDVVIHIASLKSIEESINMPLEYYENNVKGSLNLFQTMQSHSCNKIIFSSSASVYGDPEHNPITESNRLAPINPYSYSKMMVERFLIDKAKSDTNWSVIILRYFNPVGAHESGLIGEDPKGIPNNLMPSIQQVAVGRLERLNIYGQDWPTKDGTPVRDFFHIVDLALGHVSALWNGLYSNSNSNQKKKQKKRKKNTNEEEPYNVKIYNLGTGTGYSVFDILKACNKVVKRDIPYKIVGRRPGDICTLYADTSKANEELEWKSNLGIERMCEDSYRWQKNNPFGYDKKNDS